MAASRKVIPFADRLASFADRELFPASDDDDPSSLGESTDSDVTAPKLGASSSKMDVSDVNAALLTPPELLTPKLSRSGNSSSVSLLDCPRNLAEAGACFSPSASPSSFPSLF
jgi:hypothetical protein